MAASFVGMTVLVTLKDQPGSQVRGLVANVHGHTLFLNHAFFLTTGQLLPQYSIEGSQIADLELVSSDDAPPPTATREKHSISSDASQNVAPIPSQSNIPPPAQIPPQQIRIGSIAVSPPSTRHSSLAYPPPPPVPHPGTVPVLPPGQHAPMGPPSVMPPHMERFGTPQHFTPQQNPQATLQHQKTNSFVDPAILSVGRPPLAAEPAQPQSQPQEVPSTPVKPLEAAAKAPTPGKTTSPFVGRPISRFNGLGISEIAGKPKQPQDAQATLNAPFSGLGSEGEGFPGGRPAGNNDSDEATIRDGVRRFSIDKTRSGLPMDETSTKQESRKKGRRKRKPKGPVAATQAQNAGESSSPEVVRHGKKTNGTGTNAEGWRNTPILQDPHAEPFKSQARPGIITGKAATEANSASKGGSSKKKGTQKPSRRAREAARVAALSGWATEDATDIQELPDFDFEGNLSKFDKAQVFSSIRDADTTADEDRLVHFNKAPRHDQLKMLPTENVLDPLPVPVRKASAPRSVTASGIRSSSMGSSLFDDSLDSYTSPSGNLIGDPSSRGRLSHTSTRGRPSVAATMLRSNSGLSRPPMPHAPSATGVPRSTPPISPPPHAAQQPQKQRPTKPALRLSDTGRSVPVVPPYTLNALERLACQKPFYLTPQIIAEAAGRGVADVALGALNPGGKRLSKEVLRLNGRPVIVILAGRTLAASRALVAGRLLIGAGVRVMTVLVGVSTDPSTSTEDDDDEESSTGPEDINEVESPASRIARGIRAEVRRLRGCGGLVGSWADVSRELKRLDRPPELILDALLGPGERSESDLDGSGGFNFETLEAEQRELVLEVVGWANKSRAAVLAVEGPSGVDGVTGTTPMHEGEPLEVRARYVVCLGCPRVGLLRFLQDAANVLDRDTPLLWVVDVGISRVWRRHVGGKGIRFGAEMVRRIELGEGEGGVWGV